MTPDTIADAMRRAEHIIESNTMMLRYTRSPELRAQIQNQIEEARQLLARLGGVS